VVLIAAAVLPRLAAIAAGVRAAEHPTAVVALEDGPGGVAGAAIRPIHRVVDAADSALENGVAVGQRLIDAQAFFPALRAVAVSARTLKEQLDVVAEALLSLSPLVEPVVPRPGIALPFFAVVVDLTGLPRPRARLLSDIARVLAEQGQPCAVALSSSRTLSLACARLLAARPKAFRGRLLDVDAADPAWLRKTLAIDALDLDDGMVAALRATGVACVQDLVPLVDEGLVPRLGRAAPSVLRVLRLLGARSETSPPGPLSSFVERGSSDDNDGGAHGARERSELAPCPVPTDSDGLVKPLVPTEVVGASRDLEMGVTTLEPLLFVLRPLVEGIVRRLQHRRQRLAELTVALGARKKAPLVVQVPLASPTVDVAVIVRVLQTRLERVFSDEARRARVDDDGADDGRLLLHVDGVERLMLVARRTTSADARQLGLTVDDERGTPEALLHLISELQARHGEGCVGVPVVTRQRLPEAMSALVWPPEKAAPLLDEPQAHTPRRRRPRPVVVDARTRHGRFAAGWPWPLRLLPWPTTLPFSPADVAHDAPFALLEGDDDKGPYRRRYRRVTLKDGRCALTLVDDDAGVTLLSGWFE
jgi:hypothetical protein